MESKPGYLLKSFLLYLFPFIWLINWFYFSSSNGSTSAGGGGGNGSAGGGEGVGGDSGAHIDEEEWDNIDPLVDNGEPGVKVRALYDYEAAEEDELDFKAGMYAGCMVILGEAGVTRCREMALLPVGYIPQCKVPLASSRSLNFIVCEVL